MTMVGRITKVGLSQTEPFGERDVALELKMILPPESVNLLLQKAFFNDREVYLSVSEETEASEETREELSSRKGPMKDVMTSREMLAELHRDSPKKIQTHTPMSFSEDGSSDGMIRAVLEEEFRHQGDCGAVTDDRAPCICRANHLNAVTAVLRNVFSRINIWKTHAVERQRATDERLRQLEEGQVDKERLQKAVFDQALSVRQLEKVVVDARESSTALVERFKDLEQEVADLRMQRSLLQRIRGFFSRRRV